MARRKLQNTEKLAATVGNLDEYPAMPEGISPQLNLSCNKGDMPFFITCEKDTVIVQMSGVGRVEFKDSSMLYTSTVPGDYIYIPARTPHRTVCSTENMIYKYKSENAGLEAVSWFCQKCDKSVYSYTFDTANELAQEGYLNASNAFNGDAKLRTCESCGTEHPKADVSGNNWEAIVAELNSTDEDDDDDDDW